MSRFRRSGINWEDRKWSTSDALNALLDEIENAYPKSGPGDGTVASKTHDAVSPTSDHRPYPYTGTGVVNAVDAGEDIEDQGIALAEALRAAKDPRTRYVIHEERIFSSYTSSSGRKPWVWGPYSGANPHENHVHVSVLRSKQNDGSAWNLGLEPGVNVREVYARLQASLIRAGYDLGSWTPYLPANDPDSLPGADGIWGTKARAAQDAANKSGGKGPKGDKGDPGAKGAKGDPGPKGDKGVQGVAGKDGADGKPATLTITNDVVLP